MDDNSRALPPTSIGSGGVADIGAAMPSLTDPQDEIPSASSSGGGNAPPSQQQQQEQPDIIMDPSPNRVKRFVFRSRKKSVGKSLGTGGDGCSQAPQQGSSSSLIAGGDAYNTDMDVLEVIVPERIQASYGLYVWPSSPILAWYLFEHRQFLPGKRVLELGAGTGLPGVLASLCGAKVTLTDSAKLTHCLEQCRRTAEVNGVGDKVKVAPLTWGLFLNNLTRLKGQVDLLIGSDCFYDPSVFEDLISTVAYILVNNPTAKFLCTYQERSADWSIEHLLSKWDLRCKHVPLSELANSNEVDLLTLMQDHTIHLLEISLISSAEPQDVEFSS